MPISADQWRAVTGLNNVRRPRQVGIKPRYMQQETCGDNKKLSHEPEPDSNKDTSGGGSRSKRSRIKKGSRRKGCSRLEKDRITINDSSCNRRQYVGSRTISLYSSVLVLYLAVILSALNLTTWSTNNVNNRFNTLGQVIGDNSTIPEVFESSSVIGVQLLQSFISVVVMLLLLLSGDVETNPGPTTIEKPVIVEKSEDQIVKLGRSVVLTVTAKGRDMEFNWVKHGDHPNDEITINPYKDQNYETESQTDSDQNVIFKLIMKTALVYMTGVYSCKISNLGGTVSTDPRVCLTVIEPIAISSIDLSPKEGKIGVGKTASLIVEVTGTSPTYKWFRNNSEEPLTDSAVYKGTTTAILHIEEATTELSGEYWCEVSSKISPNEKSSSVHLDVIEKPVIVEKSENRIVKLGESVVLMVTAKGRDMEFKWVKHGDHPDDDITINPDNDQNYETESQFYSDQYVIFKLVIKTVLVNMTGNYSCKISNLGGTVSSHPRVHLTVMEPITINSIELSPEEGKIGVGKSASLTVDVTGTSPTYKWFRNDSEEPLTDSAVYKDTTTATLHIKEATTELSGNYWCGVSNEISPTEKSSSVHLDVSIMTFSDRMTRYDVCLWLEQNGIPKEDVQKFKEDEIDGGTFIQLPCDQGKLKQELKLTRGGANKVAKLLSEVQPHTPGPDHKEEKDDAHFPSESDIADTSELVEPITINGIQLSPEDGKISVGKSANLTVEVTGTSPVYKWFRGGMSLTDSAVYKGTTTATLHIKEATTELSGNYRCEVSNETSPDKILRSPTVHLDVMSDEQQKYLQKLDELMTAEDKIDIHYLKLYFIGMSGLGKTTFRKRLTKLYENILSLPPEERQRCSTYLAECTQVLAVISGSGLKLEVAEGHDKETQLLFQYLYTGKSESATLDNPPSENLSPNPITPTFSISKGVEVATDPLNETPVRDVKPKVIDHERISEIIQRLRGVVGSGSYHAKELLGKILLNLIDIGGQPGFLEMLPFLSGGPGMYLVFFPLDKELDEQYMVYYERDGKSILPYAAKYTVEETLSQILSAISSSHTTCNPIAHKWIGDRLEAFSKVKPLATLVGTFKDKIIHRIKKEQLKVMFPDANEKSIEAALDSETNTQASSDVENTDVDHATKQAISEKLGSAEFKEEVKKLVDEELAKKHKALKGLVKDFDEVVIPADSKRVFFAADNMHGKDSDIDPVREHLNSVFNHNLKDAKLPIRPAQLLFGIVLRKEFHIITIDECYQIGEELRMDKSEVDFALWYLHHCVGALLYHPDIKEDDDSNSEVQDQSHKKESGDKSWFENNVICSPQVVFDSISVLIVRSLLQLHSASADTHFVEREQSNWTKKGQFSLDTIRLCYTDESKKQVKDRKIIPVNKLIILLKHVNLLSPISTMVDGKEVIMYFMPAVLDCASKEDLLNCPQVDDDNPSPILITFERRYVPIGLFCAMVTRLVSRGCEGILGMKWKLMDSVVKRNFVLLQIDNRHEVTLISHVRCYELRVSRKNHKVDLNELCTYVLSTVQFVLKEISKQVKPQVAFECLCGKCRQTEKRDLSNLCKLSDGIYPCFVCEKCETIQDSQNKCLAKDAQLCRDTQLKCEKGTVDLQDSQKYWFIKNAKLGEKTKLEVFPFVNAQHLSDIGFTFIWKREACDRCEGTENELKVTAVDRTVCYRCKVSKNGTEYFTSYHFLKGFEPITVGCIEVLPNHGDGKVGEGECSLNLTVQASGTNPTYKWFGGGEPLIDSAVYKSTTTATLHITEATAKLSGDYWCEVSNEISPHEKSSSVHLDVIEKPVIVKKSEDRTVKLGGYVVLTVTAKGRDMEFNWVKHGDHPDDDITINPDNDQDYETERHTENDQNEIFKLVIKTAMANMTGNYSCKSSNLGGTVSPLPRVCLTVIEPITISSIELSPKEGKIGVGKSASLTVEVKGTSPTYKWFRNDSEEPLADSPVYKDTSTATLHIEEATAELSGNYWCEVSNEISPKEKSSSVHLDVIEKPVIVKISEDRIVKSGESVVLTVTAKGRYLEFNWVKLGDPPNDGITINLDNDQNHETESQTDGDQNVIFKLVIKTALVNMTGDYSCKISNVGGTVSPSPRVCLTVSMMSFDTSMSCDDICLWLRQNDVTDDDVQVFKKQGIDGDAFTQLPSDRTQLIKDFQLSFGGANRIAKLLSEVLTNKPGHQSNGSNADSVAGGPSGASSGPTPNAQRIEPGTGIVLEVNKHLHPLKNALLDAAYLWFPLGQALGILPGTLESIKFDRELHGDNDRLNEVLSKWIHSGQATIDQLLEALDSDPSVKRPDVANKIRSLKGEERIKVGLV